MEYIDEGDSGQQEAEKSEPIRYSFISILRDASEEFEEGASH